MDDWQVEPLGRSHQRGEFRCGKAPLDEFLRTFVSQYEKRKMGRTYVAVRPGETRVYGYYTLAASSVPVQNLPEVSAKKLPKHPVPVVLLARLAVDQSVKGRGLGEHLLFDALGRSLDFSRRLGVHAVEVVAIDAEAKAYYLKYGFEPLLDNEFNLFLPMKVVEDELGAP